MNEKNEEIKRLMSRQLNNNKKEQTKSKLDIKEQLKNLLQKHTSQLDRTYVESVFDSYSVKSS